ncbi:MAG TPA: TIGR02594 family protein [Caulobacteraceae bacterium]|jgi:uncharacterized protein (TIGR02594 family)|nr:TIGR02594 family protein [Caulobacteraceae bacterium]
MSNLPEAYAWLDDVADKPRMISEALALFGVHEGVGGADNAVILAWAHEIGGDVAATYLHDSIPWCGLFMAVVAHRSDKPIPVNPLWALNWKKFGQSAGAASLGDVLVFIRDGGGHVGLYVGEDESAYHTLGGNESDKVTIVRMPRSRLYAMRRPIWKVAQPASVTPHVLKATGQLSTDEA